MPFFLTHLHLGISAETPPSLLLFPSDVSLGPDFTPSPRIP
jgi:hypothetical protein